MLRSRKGPSALVNQALRSVVQNGGRLTVLFAGGASLVLGISRCSMLLLHVLKSVLPYVKVGKNLQQQQYQTSHIGQLFWPTHSGPLQLRNRQTLFQKSGSSGVKGQRYLSLVRFSPPPLSNQLINLLQVFEGRDWTKLQVYNQVESAIRTGFRWSSLSSLAQRKALLAMVTSAIRTPF
jgi:hypothetical protein